MHSSEWQRLEAESSDVHSDVRDNVEEAAVWRIGPFISATREEILGQLIPDVPRPPNRRSRFGPSSEQCSARLDMQCGHRNSEAREDGTRQRLKSVNGPTAGKSQQPNSDNCSCRFWVLVTASPLRLTISSSNHIHRLYVVLGESAAASERGRSQAEPARRTSSCCASLFTPRFGDGSVVPRTS